MIYCSRDTIISMSFNVIKCFFFLNTNTSIIYCNRYIGNRNSLRHVQLIIQSENINLLKNEVLQKYGNIHDLA